MKQIYLSTIYSIIKHCVEMYRTCLFKIASGRRALWPHCRVQQTLLIVCRESYTERTVVVTSGTHLTERPVSRRVCLLMTTHCVFLASLDPNTLPSRWQPATLIRWSDGKITEHLHPTQCRCSCSCRLVCDDYASLQKWKCRAVFCYACLHG